MTPPQKSKVEYFPHFCNHGKTIYVLEQKYGNDGYAFWFKILEILGNSQGHYINCNDKSMWHYLLARGIIDDIKATEILNMLSDLGAIDAELWKNKVIWSNNFVANLETVYSRRQSKPPSREILLTLIPSIGNTDDIYPDGGNINPQRKELKEGTKETLFPVKRKNATDKKYSEDFEKFWTAIIHRPEDRKADAYNHWKKQTDIPPINELLAIVEKYNASKSNTDPDKIMATFNWIKNQLYLPPPTPPPEKVYAPDPSCIHCKGKGYIIIQKENGGSAGKKCECINEQIKRDSLPSKSGTDNYSGTGSARVNPAGL
jgi:hypothetical protein